MPLKNNKKKIIAVKAFKKEQVLMYKAMLQLYPEFEQLEYQCSRKQLKDFKQIVVSAFIVKSITEYYEGEKDNDK